MLLESCGSVRQRNGIWIYALVKKRTEGLKYSTYNQSNIGTCGSSKASLVYEGFQQGNLCDFECVCLLFLTKCRSDKTSSPSRFA